MNKKLISFCILLCFVMQIFAIPAKPIKFNVKLSDGTEVTVIKRGDDAFHYLVTTDGIPVVKNTDGTYRLASEMVEGIKATAQDRRKIRNAHRIERASQMHKANALRKEFGKPSTYIGKKKGIVILVAFSDQGMKSANNRQAFDDLFNKVGYNKDGHIGSVHDYFLDSSYGKFDLEFDVFGPVTLSKNLEYYGENDEDDNDKHPAELVREACILANSNNNINWKDYDWDGDGEVEQVFIVYAGYGEHAADNDNYIWPHEFTLTDCKQYYQDGDGALTLGGAKIDTYAVSCELRGSSGSTLNGIGTACHEFSHCLGIPDFYDTSYEGSFGMSYWDVLDAGSYSGPDGWGEIPEAYSAYERWFAGWLEPVELDRPCNVDNMPAINDSAFAYIIYNDNYNNEYFILEHRKSTGYFSYLNDERGLDGLLIYHVDYDYDSWAEDIVNNDITHPRMSIIPANKNFGTYYSSYSSFYPDRTEFAGQIFPGTSNVTTLDNTSHSGNRSTAPKLPFGGKLYHKNTDGSYYMNKPVTEIAMTNGVVSFKFMGGIKMEAPEPLDPPVVGKTTFTAAWTPVEGADSYTLEYSEVADIDPGESILLEEDFSGFTAKVDGTADISSSLNSYMKKSGWSGSRVYASTNRVKIGSSKQTGYITSPAITPEEENVTVKITAAAYGTDSKTINVSLVTSAGAEISKQTLTANGKETILNFSNVTSAFRVKIAPAKRAYISNVMVYDGAFSANDFESAAKPRLAPEKHTITGITETTYTITDLTAAEYKYRVKAVSEKEGESDWTSYVKVTMADSDPISAEGDINGDGTLTIADVTMLIDMYLSGELYNGQVVTISDITNEIDLYMNSGTDQEM